jgi:hypothetical protein
MTRERVNGGRVRDERDRASSSLAQFLLLATSSSLWGRYLLEDGGQIREMIFMRWALCRNAPLGNFGT